MPREGNFLRDVAVDDLRHANGALVGEEVKGLGLDIGPFHLLPLQVIAANLGIGSRLGLFGDGLDGRRAVYWLLGARDIGDSVARQGCPRGQPAAVPSPSRPGAEPHLVQRRGRRSLTAAESS